jgi:hypothetical protein
MVFDRRGNALAAMAVVTKLQRTATKAARGVAL